MVARAAALATGLYLYYAAQSPVETELIVPFFKDVAVGLGGWYVALVFAPLYNLFVAKFG